ncbi:MAG TPA: PQQ-dependent sugar dehydrogenase [Blastocatellia bacterium]|nr:PQQ-dependent sugar dehydrogenase [Blastocatellia bacterium]
MKRAKRVLSFVTVLCGFAALMINGALFTSRAQTSVRIELEPVATNLSSPLYVTSARDGTGRLFIVERGGRIKVLAPGASTPSLFLDISSRAVAGGEQGLLGLAFHPQFETNRCFFVDYTRRPDGATVIAEYRASASNPNAADTNETVLLTIPQPFANHNGGMVEFGPDGLLYIAMGDGGSASDPGNRAQNINELLGKILRIDVDRSDGGLAYAIPPSNPFAGAAAGRDEIYAIGLRNPFRFSFDRGTGQLWAGDVGQGDREEVDVITRGGNYGWRVFEGTRCTNSDPPLCNSLSSIAPITEYSHTNGRCSITGGYVYRGAQLSLPLGSYVFADFCTGEIFLLNEGAQRVILDTRMSISSFGEDEAGEVYVVDLSGSVHRIVNPDAEDQVTARIDSVTVRRRSTGVELLPVTVKGNAKKFEIVVRGAGFAQDAKVFVNGRNMNTVAGSQPGAELVARLRKGTLARPGPITVQVVNPDNTLSNQVTLLVVE